MEYFNNLVAGKELQATSAVKQSRKVQSTDKLFMAKALSPIFTQLINASLALRPSDVPSFAVEFLTDMIKDQEAIMEEENRRLKEEEKKKAVEGENDSSNNNNNNNGTIASKRASREQHPVGATST